MNILGVGPGELAVVFIIMLVVAGPKRMVQWAYTAGRYVAQLRGMFQETLNAVQKEFAESGLDVSKDLSKIPMGRIDFLGEAAKIINAPVVQPANVVKPVDTGDAAPPAPSTPPSTAPADANSNGDSPKYDSWLPN